MKSRWTRYGSFPSVRWVAALITLCSAWTASAVEDVDLHDLNWYVHVDLVTVTEDLAYWQGVLDQQLELASVLLEGGQGPMDTPCCTRLSRSASLATFGTPGDGYDILDSASKLSNLNGLAGTSGSNSFLVDSITYCGGPAPASVGCAIQDSCSGNGNDDPDLWLAVTVDSIDESTLPLVIAHERGHNACLTHTAASACQIMQGTITNPGMSGCFTASECSNYRDGRTRRSSGQQCACHAPGGGIEADGAVCSEFAVGFCSGGLCGDHTSDAIVELLASAHPGSAGIPAPDDALKISALSGHWSNAGQITPIAEDVHGMAFAADSETLFGVIPTSGNDLIVRIDSDTGDLIEVVGSISNGAAELISMAYHPGLTASPSDDRLIMVEATATTGAIVWIDPASPSTRNQYGFLGLGPATEFKGLAYDSIQGKLFAATPIGPDGLYEIDLTSCPPSPCNASQVAGVNELFVFDSALTYSSHTGMLYQMGTAYNGTRTFYNVIDPTNGASVQTLSLDPFTPGGLAAVPEPTLAPSLLLGWVGLLWAAHPRRRRPRIPDERS